MKLTDEQQEKAIGLRGLLTKSCPDGDKAWTAHIDYTRAVACMLDAVDDMVTPTEIKTSFNAAWHAYVRVWDAQHQRVLSQALGDDVELVNKVKEHENGQRIVNRIIARIKKQHGGICSEVDASSTEITDILTEEMPDEWSE